VHAIQVLSQSGGYVNKAAHIRQLYQLSTRTLHSSILSKSNTKAGAYSGANPSQVQKPLNHSNDPLAARNEQYIQPYWVNGSDSCQYCHGSTQHSLNALGKPSQFQGDNVVNSTISTTTSWCASCHWQGYTNGTSTLHGYVNAFLGLVPPEDHRGSDIRALRARQVSITTPVLQ